MKYQLINPDTNSIDSSVDLFLMIDHMPDIQLKLGQNQANARLEYFGKNSIVDLFSNRSLDYTNYFFVLDYVNLQGFDNCSLFYPEFFLRTVVNYQKFAPDYVIDFSQKQHSVNCVMNKIRPPRILASCWFANNKIDNLLYTQSWDNTDMEILLQSDELLQLGNLIDWTHKFGPDVKMLEKRWIDHKGNDPSYYLRNSNNEKNFFHSGIKTIFDTTAISVVLEPVFWEHGSNITEKYVHAVYGGTIPLVNGYKIYDVLSQLGFDTFLDIIDTSSQYELDPILRVWNMLEKNKDVFAQWKDLISDQHIQNRLINNLNLLKTPDVLFRNILKLNNNESLQKAISLQQLMVDNRFIYADMLNVYIQNQ
jgi:hypothetical protein